VRRTLVLGLLGSALLLAAGVGPARATRECRGLMVCVPVAGPWVVVPHGLATPRATVEYQLSCPRRYVVGGLDAELSDRAIDLAFLGALGSPVNPGISTARKVVFVARYVGAVDRATSFRPHIGCIPARGHGQRIPTAVLRIHLPGQPVVRRVRTARLRLGRLHIAVACGAGERLVASSHAIGFYTSTPPSQSLARSVTALRAVRNGRVVVSGHVGAAVRAVHAVVQVAAVCAEGE